MCCSRSGPFHGVSLSESSWVKFYKKGGMNSSGRGRVKAAAVLRAAVGRFEGSPEPGPASENRAEVFSS